MYDPCKQYAYPKYLRPHKPNLTHPAQIQTIITTTSVHQHLASASTHEKQDRCDTTQATQPYKPPDSLLGQPDRDQSTQEPTFASTSQANTNQLCKPTLSRQQSRRYNAICNQHKTQHAAKLKTQPTQQNPTPTLHTADILRWTQPCNHLNQPQRHQQEEKALCRN